MKYIQKAVECRVLVQFTLERVWCFTVLQSNTFSLVLRFKFG